MLQKYTHIYVFIKGIQLHHDRRFVDLADLLVNFDVHTVGTISGDVPTYEVHIAEHLFN